MLSAPPSVLNVQHLRRTFEANRLPPPGIAIQARPLRLRLQICACSRLLSFSSRRMLSLLGPRFRLKELPVEELRWRRAIGVIYRSESCLPPIARRLSDLLRAMAQAAGMEVAH